MNSYDIDGVIYFGTELEGLTPTPNDIIITGRSYEEYPETHNMLVGRGIFNKVYYNELTFEEKTRRASGEHKAEILKTLRTEGIIISCHFEDDELQASVIEKQCPWVKVILVNTPFVSKENVRHT